MSAQKFKIALRDVKVDDMSAKTVHIAALQPEGRKTHLSINHELNKIKE